MLETLEITRNSPAEEAGPVLWTIVKYLITSNYFQLQPEGTTDPELLKPVVDQLIAILPPTLSTEEVDELTQTVLSPSRLAQIRQLGKLSEKIAEREEVIADLVDSAQGSNPVLERHEARLVTTLGELKLTNHYRIFAESGTIAATKPDLIGRDPIFFDDVELRDQSKESIDSLDLDEVTAKKMMKLFQAFGSADDITFIGHQSFKTIIGLRALANAKINVKRYNLVPADPDNNRTVTANTDHTLTYSEGYTIQDSDEWGADGPKVVSTLQIDATLDLEGNITIDYKITPVL